MPPDDARLPLRHAVALGLLQGPAEMLPVSSSAHVTLLPQLLGWPSAQLPGDVRKAFEVALHAGSLGALATVERPLPIREAALAALPAVVAALCFERPIEQRLGGLGATAAGLMAGSAVLVAADALAPPHARRAAAEVGPADALVLGLAQAAALAPGMSRLGLAVAAARARGFARPEAFDVALRAGLPLLAGATALKGVRLARSGLPAALAAPFAAGTVAALGSAVAAAPLRRRAPIRTAAAERVLLAAAALRLRRARR